jgi:hypothetical protein
VKLLYLLLASAVFFTACSQEKSQETPETTDVAPANVPPANVAPATSGISIQLDNVTLTAPETWQQEQPASKMRTFQFGVASSKEAKVVGFYFEGQAGDDDSNIQRWKNEFTSIDSEDESEILDGVIRYIKIEGTYKKKARPMAQQFTEVEGYVTMAAIVPTGKGPYYFKLNGAISEIGKEEANFKRFLKSYKKD